MNIYISNYHHGLPSLLSEMEIAFVSVDKLRFGDGNGGELRPYLFSIFFKNLK